MSRDIYKNLFIEGNNFEVLEASFVDYSSISNLLKKSDLVVLEGSKKELDRIKKELNKRNLISKRYFHLNERKNQIGIALPIDKRKILLSALSELKTFRGRSFKNKFLIEVVKIAYAIFGNLILKNQFLVIFKNGNSIYGWLSQFINLPEENIHFSIYGSSRKYNLTLFNNKGGYIGFVKLYNPGEESFYFGENEVKILQKLNKINLKSASVPEIIHWGYFKKSFAIILSPLSGLKPVSKIKKVHIDFLKEISKKTGKEIILKNSEFFEDIKKHLSEFNEFEDFLKEILREIKESKVLMSVAQREFPLHHILKYSNNYLVIDWEHAREEYPSIFDFFSLLISARRNIKGDYEERFLKNINQTFFQKNKKQAKVIKDMLSYLGVSKEESFYLFILFMIDQAFIAKKTGSLETRSRILKIISEIKEGRLKKENWLNFV